MSASVFSVKASSRSRYNSLEVEGLFNSRLVMKTRSNWGLITEYSRTPPDCRATHEVVLVQHCTVYGCQSRVPLGELN